MQGPSFNFFQEKSSTNIDLAGSNLPDANSSIITEVLSEVERKLKVDSECIIESKPLKSPVCKTLSVTSSKVRLSILISFFYNPYNFRTAKNWGI